MDIIQKKISQQGFSLIQVSALVAMAGIMLSSVLPSGGLESNAEKDRITKEKMEKIEAATQNFMAANFRRPCPADGTLASSDSNFGKEAQYNGRCSHGTPDANFSTQSVPVTKIGNAGVPTTNLNSAVITNLPDTTGLAIGMLVTGTDIPADTHIASVDSASNITLDKIATATTNAVTLTFTSVVAGVVPTKTLGLSNDFMFDGYGRRIGYMVDTRATHATTCRDMQVTKTTGAIQIMDSAAATSTTDNVMWSLISYGKNGHGAFSMQGTSVANRINSGSTSADEQMNAFVDGSFSATPVFTQKLVRHEPIPTADTTYFDDTVWTQESSKNTCCTGKLCMAGTRIDGAENEYLGADVKIGDINGDGIPDMVITQAYTNKMRVVFGSATGWAPNAGLSMATPNSSRFITITNNSGLSNFAKSIAVGDIDGDGYDDIAIGYGNISNSFVVIFPGSPTPADTNFTSLTNKITLPKTAANLTANSAPKIALGDFNGDGKKDILALISSSAAYVVYGKAGTYSGSPPTTSTVPVTITAESPALLVGSTGFKITKGTGSLDTISGIGNVNNDQYDDILISGYSMATPATYLILGRASWVRDAGDGITVPDSIVATTQTSSTTTGVKFTGGSNLGRYTIAVADMNNDDIKDIIINSANYFNVYYGIATFPSATVDLTNSANFNGTLGFRFDVVTNKPTALYSASKEAFIYSLSNAVILDINGDRKNDIVFNDSSADTSDDGGGGTNLVALQPSGGWGTIGSGGIINLFGNIFKAGIALPLNNDASKGFRIDGYNIWNNGKLIEITDMNNDGKPDLILNAPDHSNATAIFSGSVYIFFGRTLVPWDTKTSLKILN